MIARDRIRGLARLPAERVRPSKKNFRTHGDRQRVALRGLLSELGMVGALLVWVPDPKARKALRSASATEFDAWLAGYHGPLELLDGHMRAEELAGSDVPVLVTDLDEREAAQALATFDSVGDLAGKDASLLASLLSEVRPTVADAGTLDLLALLSADAEAPIFEPVGQDEQGTLDATKPLVCPACGHTWSR